MKQVVIGPGVNTRSPEFADALLQRGIQPGESFRVVETDAYASNLPDLVGSNPFVLGPGIHTFGSDEEYLEHLDARITSRHDWDVTLDQYAVWSKWQEDKGLLEKSGEFLGGVGAGAKGVVGQAIEAGKEVGGAIAEGQGTAKTAVTAAESLGRWFTGLGVMGSSIKDSVVNFATNATMAERYERFLDQKRYEADLAAEEGSSLVGDFANVVSPEFADAVQSKVMHNAADVGAIAADIVIGAKGTKLLPKLGTFGAQTSAVARKASELSALPAGAARKIAEASLKGVAAAGRITERNVTKLGKWIDGIVKGDLMKGVAVGSLTSQPEIAAGILGYRVLRKAAGPFKSAAVGSYTVAKHIVAQSTPHQLGVWQRIMRDSAAPSWVRGTAAAANHVFGRRSGRIAAAATHGAIVEAAQESLTEWLSDPLDYRGAGEAAGAALVIGGGLHAGLSLGEVDKLDAFYRNLDRLDYRESLPNKELFDKLDTPTQFGLSDAAAFLGDKFRVEAVTGDEFRQRTGRDGAGVFLDNSKTLLINADASRPGDATILHEVGHALYDAVPRFAKDRFRAAVENAYGKEAIDKFAADYAKSIGDQSISQTRAWDEMFAEQFMGVASRTPLLQTSSSLPTQAKRLLDNARAALFREWATAANMDATAPEGMLEFTPWENDPVIRRIVEREITHALNGTTHPSAKAIRPTTPSSRPDPSDRQPTQKPATTKARTRGEGDTKSTYDPKKEQWEPTRQAERMAELWNAGKSYDQIATEIGDGMYKVKVERTLKKFRGQIPIISVEENKALRTGRPVKRGKSVQKAERNAKIIAMSEAGKSTREIGREMGLSHNAIHKIVQESKAAKALEAEARAESAAAAPESAASPDSHRLSPDPMPPREIRPDFLRKMISGESVSRSIALPDGRVIVPIEVDGDTLVYIDADEGYNSALYDTPDVTDPRRAYLDGIRTFRAGGDPGWLADPQFISLDNLDGARLLSHDGYLDHTLAANERARFSPDIPATLLASDGPEVETFLTEWRSGRQPEWELSELGEPIARAATHTDYPHPSAPDRIMRVPAGFSGAVMQPDGKVSTSPRRPLSYMRQMQANRDLGGDVRWEGIVRTPTGPKPLHSLPGGRPATSTDVQRWLYENGFAQDGTREDGARIDPRPEGFVRDRLTGQIQPSGALVHRDIDLKNSPENAILGDAESAETDPDRATQSALSGGSFRPMGPEQPRSALQGAFDQRPWIEGGIEQLGELDAQDAALAAWARENGRFLEPETAQKLASQAERTAVGNEHNVMLAGDTVIRFTKNNQFGLPFRTPAQYLRRWELFNALFPDTAVQFVGYTTDAQGNGIIITQQPLVDGEVRKPADVAKAMGEMGFRPMKGIDHAFVNDDTGVELYDTHEQNVLFGQDGKAYPIDVWVVDREGALDVGRPVRLSPDMQPVSEFAESLKSELRLRSLEMHENKQGDLVLGLIVVPEGSRNSGTGSAAIQRIVDYADRLGKRLILSTSAKDPSLGTTSSSRLKRFYKRFGFVENKGRNKDFSVTENMLRDPST